MNSIDTLPYRTFLKLKEKFPVKTIVLDQAALSGQGMHLIFKDHRAYVAHKFSVLGVDVTRFNHEYNSLSGAHPRLGLVYLVNDSAIVPAMEVHALIGHNAVYLDKAAAAVL